MAWEGKGATGVSATNPPPGIQHPPNGLPYVVMMMPPGINLADLLPGAFRANAVSLTETNTFASSQINCGLSQAPAPLVPPPISIPPATPKAPIPTTQKPTQVQSTPTKARKSRSRSPSYRSSRSRIRSDSLSRSRDRGRGRSRRRSRSRSQSRSRSNHRSNRRSRSRSHKERSESRHRSRSRSPRRSRSRKEGNQSSSMKPDTTKEYQLPNNAMIIAVTQTATSGQECRITFFSNTGDGIKHAWVQVREVVRLTNKNLAEWTFPQRLHVQGIYTLRKIKGFVEMTLTKASCIPKPDVSALHTLSSENLLSLLEKEFPLFQTSQYFSKWKHYDMSGMQLLVIYKTMKEKEQVEEKQKEKEAKQYNYFYCNSVSHLYRKFWPHPLFAEWMLDLADILHNHLGPNRDRMIRVYFLIHLTVCSLLDQCLELFSKHSKR